MKVDSPSKKKCIPPSKKTLVQIKPVSNYEYIIKKEMKSRFFMEKQLIILFAIMCWMYDDI